MLGGLDRSHAGRSALFCVRVALLGSNQVLGLASLTEYSLVFVLRAHLMHFRGPSALQSLLLWRVTDVFLLDLEQVELLWSKDGTGSCDPDPADKGLGRDLVVFHGIEADECARAAEAGLAVDSDGASVRVLEVFLTGVHELFDDILGRGRAISEYHVVMSDVLGEEGCAIVFSFVQADHSADIEVLEDVDVAGSSVAVAVHGVPLIYWSHEG